MIRTLMLKRWPALAAAGAATIVVALAELAAPWPLKVVLDRLLGDRPTPFELTSPNWTLLAVVAAAAIGIAIVQALSDYASTLWLKQAGEAIVHDLRVATYNHLQRLSLSYHDARHKGDLVQRITADVNAVGQIFAESLGAITAALLLLARDGDRDVLARPRARAGAVHDGAAARVRHHPLPPARAAAGARAAQRGGRDRVRSPPRRSARCGS